MWPSRMLLALLAAITLGACGEPSPSKPTNQCPDGIWRLSPVSTRDLIGLELGNTTAEIRGTVTLSLNADGATQFLFDDLTIGGANIPGGAQKTTVSVTGAITAETTRSGSDLDVARRNNTLQVTSGDRPAGGGLTAFISGEFEKDLTGPATFACRGQDLVITDTTRGTQLLWNPVTRG